MTPAYSLLWHPSMSLLLWTILVSQRYIFASLGLLTCPLSPQLLQLSPPPIPAPGAATNLAAHWAADGLHALAQLPAQCAAAAHAAHVPCDLPALLAAVGPAGWSEPRFHHP